MADRGSKFWDRIARRYAKQPLANPEAYLQKLQTIRGAIDRHTDVLEIGCGTGSTAILMAPNAGCYRAVDISEKMLAIARAKAERAEIDNLVFEHAGVDDLALESESLDVVIAMNILHLLRDPNAAIARIHDALRPGGVFISSTVCLGDWLRFMRYVAPIGRAVGLLPVLRVISADELEAAIQGPGFTIEERWQPTQKSGVFIVASKAMPPRKRSKPNDDN